MEKIDIFINFFSYHTLDSTILKSTSGISIDSSMDVDSDDGSSSQKSLNDDFYTSIKSSAMNMFGVVYLTNSIIPLLAKGTDSKIIFSVVNNPTPYYSAYDLKLLLKSIQDGTFDAYHSRVKFRSSQLFLTMYYFALQKQLRPDNISVVVLHDDLNYDPFGTEYQSSGTTSTIKSLVRIIKKIATPRFNKKETSPVTLYQKLPYDFSLDTVYHISVSEKEQLEGLDGKIVSVDHQSFSRRSRRNSQTNLELKKKLKIHPASKNDDCITPDNVLRVFNLLNASTIALFEQVGLSTNTYSQLTTTPRTNEIIA